MLKATRLTVVPALTLALAAGMAATASTQNTDAGARAAQPDRNISRSDQAMPAGVDFRSTKWIKGRDVINERGDKVADVSDMILDRGTGRVDYIVVRPGITGKTVALPYTSFGWDAGKEKFVLALTKDQLKQYPDFDADKWSAMMESKDRKDLKDNARAEQPDGRAMDRDSMLYQVPSSPDVYAGKYDTAKQMHIEGEVKKVERVRTGDSEEQVVITVAASDGTTKKVSLGPSWFVSGGSVSPMRGDKIVADVYGVRDDNQIYTASSLKIGDQDFNLRQKKSGNAWWSSSKVEHGDRSYSTPYWHYVMADHVRGMKVDCRGVRCGKVDEVIVDRNSGEIALLSIDPDVKFLGIGDTKRLVPWSIASIALDGTVRLDATKDMMLASPVTPSDLTKLNTGTMTQMVYNAYQVPMPDFQVRRPAAQGGDR